VLKDAADLPDQLPPVEAPLGADDAGGQAFDAGTRATRTTSTAKE
jgi:hypothetical protein